MNYYIKEPQSLLEALTKLAPDSSKTTLRSWIKQGRIQVNGHKELRADKLLEPDQKVTLGNNPQQLIGLGVRIIYKDPHLVAIYKPAKLLTVTAAAEDENTAHALVKKHFYPKRVFVVHRLDQDTSGVMLFALSEECRDKLKIIFEKHDIGRYYTAVVEGCLPLDSQGTWDSFLYEDASYRVRVVAEKDIERLHARQAITHYKVIAQKGSYTQLELKLETGRKNQIRVHCEQAGLPVVGDAKYGYKGREMQRLGLHARLLELIHPITGKTMRFEAPLPLFFSRFFR